MALLEADNLVKIYRGRGPVVNEVSYSVEPGEVVGLLGPNGAGKTTSFRMTVGMIAADSGTVSFAGKDVTRLPMYRRARLGMGYLSQEPSVFRELTVEANILAVLETLGLPRKRRRELLERHLAELGLTPIRKTKARQLSGGERRRLEITRSLVTSPKLLLLDEPFSGVDPIAVSEIQDIVLRLRRAWDGHPAHGPQRARDALHNRPRLHHLRRARSSARGRRGSSSRTASSGASTSGRDSACPS